MKKLILIISLMALNCLSATNYIYKNSEIITYWNPPSGGMMITETNSTRKVDFLYGRNYIKTLIQLGWSTTKPDASVVSVTNAGETKASVSPTNVFFPMSTRRWITILENHRNFCLVSIQDGPTIKIILEGNVPITLYKDPPTEIERKRAIRNAEESRLDKWESDLEYRDGQIPIAAGGDPAYVDRVMNMRRRLNAEYSNYKNQRKNFEKNCALLAAEEENYRRSSPTHHSTRIEAYFTGQKQDDVPIWKIVR